MNAASISTFVDALWNDSIVPELVDYVRIPNKSPAFDPDWQTHGYMQAAVEQLSAWVDNMNVTGLTQRIVTLPGRTPLLLVQIEGTGSGRALLYGHYDKQPEFDGWHDGLGPWTPVIKNGRLYGRGGADDGYALFGSIAAVAALKDQGIPHPHCTILVEGCEESGSFDLPHYMDALADEIGTPDLVVCLDAECGNYDQLWITNSLRGTLPGTLTVRVLTEGVHSGAAGGVVPSSFRVLREVIERVEHGATGDIEALNVTIPDAIRRQADGVAACLGDLVVDRFPWAGATHAADRPLAEHVIANTWGPSLAVVGLDGAPTPANAGNTLRPATIARLVFRLPPTLDADHAADAVRSAFETDPPYGADVRFQVDHAQTGWAAKDRADWLETALASASEACFGAPLMTMGTGGTIPFMKMLGDRFPNVQFAVTGVLGPNSNAHGPNEFLDIDTGRKVTACMSHALAGLAER